MHLFLTLFIKIIPLYILIALGFIAGKKLNAKKETIASILIYIIVPVIVFNSITSAKINFELLLLPLIFFMCCSGMGLTFYAIGKHFFKDSTRNILAFTAGTANTGYFGIPVAIELFGEESLTTVIMCILGFTIFENTIGFFLTARGSHTVKDSIKRLLKLPTIYAFITGLIVNWLGIKFGHNYETFTKNFIGAYTVTGMMLIGLALSDMKSFKPDIRFVSLSLIAKFIVWPLMILIIIFIDQNFIHLFDLSIYRIMMLMAVVPLAANTVAFATELKAQPEKASFAVFVSTIIALIYIPLLTALFLR